MRLNSDCQIAHEKLGRKDNLQEHAMRDLIDNDDGVKCDDQIQNEEDAEAVN